MGRKNLEIKSFDSLVFTAEGKYWLVDISLFRVILNDNIQNFFQMNTGKLFRGILGIFEQEFA